MPRLWLLAIQSALLLTTAAYVELANTGPIALVDLHRKSGNHADAYTDLDRSAPARRHYGCANQCKCEDSCDSQPHGERPDDAT